MPVAIGILRETAQARQLQSTRRGEEGVGISRLNLDDLE
jgi:hypothetical protein